LAFAVAAHLEPDILIVDEVLAVGDAHFQKKCLGKMGEVSQSGRTVLFVSHNLHAVRKLCSRALILAEGRLTYSGSVGDGIDRYQQIVNESDGPRPRDGAVADGMIRFTDWRLIESGPRLAHACYAREECRFEFTLVCRRPVDRMHLGFTIRALDDTILISGHNLEDNGVPARFRSGEYRIVWTTRVPLPAGTYQLEVGAASPDEAPRRADDWRPAALLEVIDPAPAFLPPAWRGLVNERVTCEIREAEPAAMSQHS
jgi:lipopolysaccharide transport system ATP-binding protein